MPALNFKQNLKIPLIIANIWYYLLGPCPFGLSFEGQPSFGIEWYLNVILICIFLVTCSCGKWHVKSLDHIPEQAAFPGVVGQHKLDFKEIKRKKRKGKKERNLNIQWVGR